jgi:hypothetical protein
MIVWVVSITVVTVGFSEAASSAHAGISTNARAAARLKGRENMKVTFLVGGKKRIALRYQAKPVASLMFPAVFNLGNRSLDSRPVLRNQ